MKDLRLSVSEKLCLLLTGIGTLWVSDQVRPDTFQTKEPIQEPITQDVQNPAEPLELQYTGSALDFKSQTALPVQTNQKNFSKILTQKTVTNKISSNKAKIRFVSHSADNWNYLIRFQAVAPLFLEHRGWEDYPEEIHDISAVLDLTSPYHLKRGSIRIRAQIPFHRLWQDEANTYDYPKEIQKLYQSEYRAPIALAYHSRLYLGWIIPPLQSKKNQNKTTNSENPQNYWGSHLQVGSIRPHSESAWYTLRSSLSFQSSRQSLSSMPKSTNVPGASTTYDSQNGLGKNIGFSWDSRVIQILILHQRSSREEHLSSGLTLRFDHLPKADNNQEPIKNTVQNIYRLRFAGLFSQNLSKPNSDSSWYLNHTQSRQNMALYQANPDQRWGRLLRYDRSVKQFYMQAGWKHNIQKGRGPNAYLQLNTEQGFSISPLDYWGNLQKYYVKFQFPIFQHPTLAKRAILYNEFYAAYQDSHWIDARRRLASSVTNRWYGKRFNLQNRFILNFEQRPQKQKPSQSLNESYKQSSKDTISRLYRQTLHIDTGIKTIRLFHSTQASYWNFGADYYWLWQHRNQILSHVWHLMLGGDLYQSLPLTNDIHPTLVQFPTALWQWKLNSGLGWQQRPPSRKPLANNRNRVHRLGWKTTLSNKVNTQTIEQSSLVWDLFLQLWHYYSAHQNKRTVGWERLFRLQFRFGLACNWEETAYLTFRTKLQAWFALSRDWSVNFAVELREWKQIINRPAELPKSLQLELKIQYQFHSPIGAATNSQITNPTENVAQSIPQVDPLDVSTEPLKELEQAFQEENLQEEDPNDEDILYDDLN